MQTVFLSIHIGDLRNETLHKTIVIVS